MTDNSAPLSSLALWVGGIALFQFFISKVQSHPNDSAQGHKGSDTAAAAVVSSFPLRDELHLQRKAQHALTGLLFIAASHVLPMEVAAPLLFALSALFFVLHELRKRYPRVDELYLESFRGILRRDEAAKRVLPGAFYFLLGTALAAALFPLPVARLAVLHLSVGDPAASLCGTLYRHHKSISSPSNPSTRKLKRRAKISIFSEHKSLAGVLGAFVASTLVSFASFSLSAGSGPSSDSSTGLLQSVAALCTKALFAGAAAATAEAIAVLDWDDNLTLPLLSGQFLQLGSLAFGFEY